MHGSFFCAVSVQGQRRGTCPQAPATYRRSTQSTYAGEHHEKGALQFRSAPAEKTRSYLLGTLMAPLMMRALMDSSLTT